MRRRVLGAALGSALAIGIFACTPARPGGDSAPDASSSARAGRALVMAIRYEPTSLATRELDSVSVGQYTTKRAFNAQLAILDERGIPRPYLAETLPQLNTESWRVFPDGRMETTYHLRPGISWHDGEPFSAEDFAFAWRVYSAPELGQAASSPLNRMEDVSAADPRTLIIRWKQPYPDIELAWDAFPPLPRHILEGSFQQLPSGGFPSQPYWTREYVGLGPYRLERWEPGAFLEAAAFEGHVLGRAKIERIKIQFIPDGNTALASLLSGQIDVAADSVFQFSQSLLIKQDWVPRTGGVVLFHANQWYSIKFQFKPELADPPLMRDRRVRKALAFTIDKQALNDGLFGGAGSIAESMIHPTVDYFPLVDRAITKYPLDLRRGEQLMIEAGLRKGADGFYAATDGERFTPELKTNATPDNDALRSSLASHWRDAGFEVKDAVLSAAQAQDAQARANFASMFANNAGLGDVLLNSIASDQIPTESNRWTGNNRGGWTNAEYDGLIRSLSGTLDRGERTRQIVRMTQLISEELPVLPLFFGIQSLVHVAEVRGPHEVAPLAVMGWDIQDWELL